jgi:hypothetical protein
VATPFSLERYLGPLSRCALPVGHGKVHIAFWAVQGKKKEPYYFLLPGGQPFAFAGLWERWQGGDEEILSCGIVTTEANGVVRPVHTRMPVILPLNAYAEFPLSFASEGWNPVGTVCSRSGMDCGPRPGIRREPG